MHLNSKYPWVHPSTGNYVVNVVMLVSLLFYKSTSYRISASTSYDEFIKLWDWAETEELCTLNSPSGSADTLAFAVGGVTLVSGGHNGTVKTWDLTAPNNQNCLK